LLSQRQQQQQTTTRTKKPVVSTCASKCLTKSPDSEEDNDGESVPKLKAKNIQLTPKLNRLRPRTAGAGTKEFVNNSHKSSASSSSSEKKRKEDETDDDNMKQIRKKKKNRTCCKRTLDIKFFPL
jgi:hypothetical protein